MQGRKTLLCTLVSTGVEEYLDLLSLWNVAAAKKILQYTETAKWTLNLFLHVAIIQMMIVIYCTLLYTFRRKGTTNILMSSVET